MKANPGARPTALVAGRAKVAVWERGSGPQTVVLLPGFPDHAIGLLGLAEELAGKGFRALAVSYPGYWPSGPAPDGDYSTEAVARDLLAVLDELALERVDLVGHGWGALYGYFLGSYQPERVHRLVAIAAPHPAGFELRHRILAEQQTAAYAYFLAYAANGPELARDPRWLTSLAQHWSPGLRRADWSNVLELLAQPGVGDAVCAYYRSDLEGRGRATGAVHVPTTIIHGAQTRCIRPALFAGLDGWFTASVERHLLPGAAHWPHLERPREVIPLVLGGLRR